MDVSEQLNSVPLPFAKEMGVRYTRASKEAVEAELEVKERLCTLGSILHGGAIMAFADTVGAVSTTLNLPPDARGTTTIESKTNFFGAARVGETVKARSEPLHVGRTTQVWQTRLWVERDGDKKNVASVVQTQLVLAG